MLRSVKYALVRFSPGTRSRISASVTPPQRCSSSRLMTDITPGASEIDSANFDAVTTLISRGDSSADAVPAVGAIRFPHSGAAASTGAAIASDRPAARMTYLLIRIRPTIAVSVPLHPRASARIERHARAHRVLFCQVDGHERPDFGQAERERISPLRRMACGPSDPRRDARKIEQVLR